MNPIFGKRKKFLASLSIAVVAAASLTACSRGESAGDADAEGSGTDTSSVAALGFGDADTLLALGIQPSVVAPFTPNDVNDKGVGPWSEDLFTGPDPVLVQNLGQGLTAEAVEKVSSANPTQIVAINQAIDDQARNDLESIAPLATHSDEYDDWSVPWDVQVREVSEAVDKSEEGDALIEDTKKAFEDYRNAHPEIEGQKAAIALPYEGRLGIYTEGDGRGAFLTELGYEIPEALQAADEGSFFMDLSPENYSLLDELDVLYILEYEGQEDEVRNNEAFKNLDIVQDDKVRFVPQEVGNAMSMPNPVTIPWALDNFDA